jgi:hypothetical protein
MIKRKMRAYIDLPTYMGSTVTHAQTVSNISLSGCFLKTNAWLDVGAVVSLRIQPPNSEGLDITGRIARRHEEPVGYGIGFEELSEADRQKLALLIAEADEPAE